MKKYIQYLDLPKIPIEILDQLPRDLTKYSLPDNFVSRTPFLWSSDFNDHFNRWCKWNIGPDMFYALQAMTVDQPKHKDRGSLTKLNYIFELGGNNVVTSFWDKDTDDAVLLDQYVIEPFRWHIFKADCFHSVDNITPGLTRMAVTARVF